MDKTKSYLFIYFSSVLVGHLHLVYGVILAFHSLCVQVNFITRYPRLLREVFTRLLSDKVQKHRGYEHVCTGVFDVAPLTQEVRKLAGR